MKHYRSKLIHPDARPRGGEIPYRGKIVAVSRILLMLGMILFCIPLTSILGLMVSIISALVLLPTILLQVLPNPLLSSKKEDSDIGKLWLSQ